MGERTIVHLLRHGEVYTPSGVLYGRWPDFHLSELGQEMAQRVADTATLTKPHSYSVGFALVLVNGRVVVEDDALTGERPGKILRHHR